jgi:transposase
MSRTYRHWSPEQAWMFPPSPRDWLPEEHLVYFLMDVTGQVDLSAIFVHYEKGKAGGQPPYHPRMMVTLLLYAYCTGVFSSRRIMARCQSDAAFRVIVGEDIPDFRTISDFRRIHLPMMQELFVEVLQLCRESGLLKVGRLAVDGTKVKANASRHQAMSYDRMTQEEQRLQQEIDELLQQAQFTDEEEDARHGKDRTGEELPDELARRESRLKKIKQAKAALEEQARQKARDKAAQWEAEGKTPRQDPEQAVPEEKAQRNFTDPDSKIMKVSNKGFDQCGNAQAVVNESQIIIAADVTNQTNDVQQIVPMLEQSLANLESAGVKQVPQQVTADAGYFSGPNVAAVEDMEIAPFIATQRLKHNEQIPSAPKGRIPHDLTPKQRMARKLRTKKGRETYSKRKGMIEPVFGQIKGVRGFRQFFMRGLEKMQGEWTLVCLTHNLLKLFRAETA